MVDFWVRWLICQIFQIIFTSNVDEPLLQMIDIKMLEFEQVTCIVLHFWPLENLNSIFYNFRSDNEKKMDVDIDSDDNDDDYNEEDDDEDDDDDYGSHYSGFNRPVRNTQRSAIEILNFEELKKERLQRWDVWDFSDEEQASDTDSSHDSDDYYRESCSSSEIDGDFDPYDYDGPYFF